MMSFEFELVPIDKIKGRGRYGAYRRIINEFLDMNVKTVEVKMSKGMRKAYNGLYMVLRRNPLHPNVKLIRRDSKIFLERNDLSEGEIIDS